MSEFNNSEINVPSVGYTEMKRKVKILKAVAIVLTIWNCLGYIPLGLLFLVFAPNLESDFWGPLTSVFSVGLAFFGVVAFIFCIIAVAIVWLLYHALKKRVEQGKPILPIITVITIFWLLPRAVSMIMVFVGALSALAEHNLNFII